MTETSAPLPNGVFFSQREVRPILPYSVKGVDRGKSEKLSGFRWSEFSAIAPMSFIFKRPVISQAGRRRFDPGLPLHFQELTSTKKPELTAITA